MFEACQVRTDEFHLDLTWVAQLQRSGGITRGPRTADDVTDMRRKCLAVAVLSAIGRRDAAIAAQQQAQRERADAADVEVSNRDCPLDASATQWIQDTNLLFSAHSTAYRLTCGENDQAYAGMNESIMRWI